MDSSLNYKVCVIVYTFCLHLTIGEEITCDPTEEHTVYKTHFFLKPEPHISDKILVDTHHGRIGICTDLRNCSNELPLVYNTTLSQINGSYVITIIAFNISRSNLPPDEAYYLMISYGKNSNIHEARFTCKPKVFVKPQGLNCSSQIYDEGLQLTCYAHKLYPKGKCHAMVYLNNLGTKAITSEVNEELPNRPTYFNTWCTVLIPKSYLSPGDVDVNVTLYPTVNNNESDIQYGLSLSKHFILENPSVKLVDCQQAVEEGNEIKCLCAKNSNDRIDAVIQWYNISGDQLHNVQKEVLLIQAHTLIQEFYCMSTNKFGWKSQKSHYKPRVYYSASVKQLTVNGESKEEFHVRDGSILSFNCEVDGNPSPTLKLLNGPVILKETWNMAQPFVLDWSYKMTCESYNKFTCSAEQLNKQSIKDTFVYTNCSNQLRIKSEEPSLRLVKTHLNSDVSFEIDIYGHPKPNVYRLIKRDTIEFNFNIVRDGNVQAYGYIIRYQDEFPPYGTINLTFKIIEKIDFTNYTLIIDNAVGTALNYTFAVMEVSGDDQPRNTEFVIGVTTGFGLFLFLMLAGLFVSWHKKGTELKKERGVNDFSCVYEEINYEEIELNNVVDNVVAVNNDEGKDDASDLTKGRSSYDSVEEIIMLEVNYQNSDINRVIERTNQYDILSNDKFKDYHKYNVIDNRTMEWDTEYIDVIEEMVLDENRLITTIDNQENDQVTSVLKEQAEHTNEYICVIDVTYEEINGSK